jgi:hypothetical protein
MRHEQLQIDGMKGSRRQRRERRSRDRVRSLRRPEWRRLRDRRTAMRDELDGDPHLHLGQRPADLTPDDEQPS